MVIDNKFTEKLPYLEHDSKKHGLYHHNVKKMQFS